MGLLTAQAKVCAVVEVPSSATRVTLYGPCAAAPAATVPVTSPVEGSMVSPAGRPVAAKDKVPPPETVRDSDTVSPSLLLWPPGLVRLIGLLTFQTNVCVAT